MFPKILASSASIATALVLVASQPAQANQLLSVFRSAFSKAPENLRSKSVREEVFLTSHASGRAGQISKLTTDPKSTDVTLVTYSMPESEVAPEALRVTNIAGRTGVVRHYDLLSGPVSLHQDYQVELLNGRFVRTQINEKKSTKEFEALVRATPEGEIRYSLVLNSPGPGGQRDFIGKFHLPVDVNGRIVGYSVAGSGQSIRVHFMKGDEVLERILTLKPDPKAPEGDPSNFHVENVSKPRPLAASEIEKLGYFKKANIQTFAGRTEASGKAPRSLQVGGQQ
jgi:hypothetical protein